MKQDNEPKTAKEWFEQYFPEPLRSIAIKKINNNISNEKFQSLPEALETSFNWGIPKENEWISWEGIYMDCISGKYYQKLSSAPPPVPEKKEKTIYDLELHEILNIGVAIVLRVPGGWIYTQFKEGVTESTFVPYNEEFKNK